MDCANARLLLNFVRAGELDPAEREALDHHLSACADCTACAQAEGRLHDALATAMQRVPVPAGLKDRILQRLAGQRRPRPWRWAAAAALVLAVGGGYFVISGPQEFDVSGWVEKYIDSRWEASPETVEARFSEEMGIAMRAPPEFNFKLLDHYDSARIQGRTVAKLTFLSRSNALAHVYVLPRAQFKLPADLEEAALRKSGFLNEIIPASSHNIKILGDPKIPDFFYVVVYTSASLDPFTFQGI